MSKNDWNEVPYPSNYVSLKAIYVNIGLIGAKSYYLKKYSRNEEHFQINTCSLRSESKNTR